MHRRIRNARWLQCAAAIAITFVGFGACTLAAQAQPAPASAENVTLKQVFDAAWARQPEASALQARRDAARAQQQVARAWTPEPAALELSNKTDRLNRNQGGRELEVGIAVPIWLPGEQARSAALADAQERAVESHATAAQLRVSATVRDAWWQWQRARAEADAARDQLANAQRIAADVSRRLRAGDLARADQHQADGAVATAEATLANAQAAVSASHQELRAGAGIALAALDAARGSHLPEPEPSGPDTEIDTHAALLDLRDRAAVAERSAALTTTRSRANPELTLAMTRERDAFGERNQQSITLGVRIPFGAGARHDARNASAQADATEARTLLALARERLIADRESARARVDAARLQRSAADRRLLLARESRGFFDKSFRLGETDLPTRLRIELEATDAERQAARSGIELAAAISGWRQALGLMPQ